MSPSASAEVRCCPACGAVYRAAFARCVNDGAELVLVSRDPLIGVSIGPYVVDALLGEGGMGRVYRVHHARLTQKRYALKVLLGDLAATPAMRMRFAKEAQSASRLCHPNVVAVNDFGVTDAGLAYLAMDLVEGRPLNALIGNRPIAPDRVIQLARQLCAGLAHAHDLGLIHRDFKPDNILVVDGPAGEVARIADFGLAISSDDSDARLTTSGIVMGTPAYIAPEQCTTGDVDHRADLYALGVTLFEALTGGFLPFDGDPAEIVGLKATATAPAISERAPHVKVPPALAAIVERLLARDPDDRYPDARAVNAALDEAVRYPDERAIAGSARQPRLDDTTVSPVRRRADRADDVAGEQASERMRSTPVPRESRGAGVRTDQLRAPRRSGAGLAIIAGAIALAGVVVAAVAWSSRSGAEPRSPRPVSTGTATARATPDAQVERAPEVIVVPAVASPKRPPDRARTPRRVAKSKSKSTRPVEPTARPAIEAPAQPVVEPAPPPRIEPTPPPPIVLEPRFAGLDVQGALPNAAVQRALDRVLPATRGCRSDRAGSVEIRFAIGESRRASAIHATGLAASGCLANALSALRTEAAPDVGDATVRVRFAYDPPKSP